MDNQGIRNDDINDLITFSDKITIIVSIIIVLVIAISVYTYFSSLML